jgi:ketosteroid isomerase-like protein
MTDLHSNVTTYLQAIDAFNRDDLAAVHDHVRSDVVYRIPGRSPVAGEFRGIDGFAEILRRLRERSGGTIALEPLTVLAAARATTPVPHAASSTCSPGRGAARSTRPWAHASKIDGTSSCS